MAKKLVEVAWAAGLFEGEGSFTICGTQRQPRVQLAMTDEDAVRRFAAIVERGNVRGYNARSQRHKPYWQWSVESKEGVLYVLNLLWPFLGERRRERAYELIERAAKLNDDEGFCKRGHDLSEPEHLYVHRKTGKRHCRTCRREGRWVSRQRN